MPDLKKLQTIAMIPLHLAVLCEECKCLSNTDGDTCPACGAKGHLSRPAPWLEEKGNRLV